MAEAAGARAAFGDIAEGSVCDARHRWATARELESTSETNLKRCWMPIPYRSAAARSRFGRRVFHFASRHGSARPGGGLQRKAAKEATVI